MSMVVNGASFRCIWWWDRHFGDTEENVRTEIVKSQGLVSDNIYDMMREMKAMAAGTRAENFMWIADLSPRPGKHVTEQQWERMRQIVEERRGLKGEVYFIIEQEKADGRVHRHLVESRIDLEKGRAIPDGEDAKICHAASRQICEEFGWERNISPFDKDREGPRPKRAPKRWEMYRGMKTGLDPRAIQVEVTALFHQSDNGRAFHAALEEHGYQLVTGRRGLLILDSAGKEHSLARRIEGTNKKELDAFMRDVDREALPTLEQGKAQYQERKIAGLEADRATVRDEIEWEEALAKAAIAKEQREQRFIAPEDREKETWSGRKREKGRRERDWPINPPQPERKHWTDFDGAAREAASDNRPEKLKGEAAKVWEAWRQIDGAKHAKDFARLDEKGIPFSVVTDAKAFAAALDEKGIAFARVTKEEAERSQRESAFAREIGRYAPRYKEGEIVIVTEPRLEYRRNGEVSEPRRRVHKLDQSLAEKFVKSLGSTGKLQGIDATRQASDQRAQQRSADWQAIRLERATTTKRAPRPRAGNTKDNLLKRPAAILSGPSRAINIIAKPAELLSNAIEGLFAPKLTPEQIREGEIAARERKAEGRDQIETSNFTAQRAQERQQEELREAARQREREREGGGRER